MTYAKPSASPLETAVKIVVCTGVILLLIAILLPSFNHARERRKPSCLFNLKVLGLATYMYQADYNGLYPSAGTNTAQPDDWIHWQSGRDPTKSALVPYTGSTFVEKVYLCPDDPQIRPANLYQFSYTANINIFTGGTPSVDSTHAPLRYAQIKNPSAKITLVEEEGATIDDAAWEPQHTTPASNKNTLAVRHEKFQNTSAIDDSKSTAAFADGHAEYLLRRDAMTQRSYDPSSP